MISAMRLCLVDLKVSSSCVTGAKQTEFHISEKYSSQLDKCGRPAGKIRQLTGTIGLKSHGNSTYKRFGTRLIPWVW